MKKLCNTLGVIILILGTIGAVILAYQYGNVERILYGLSSTYTTRDWGLTIVIFCSSFIGTLVLFAILEGIGSILNNQETLTYKITEIESKISLLDEKMTRSSAYSATMGSDVWKCENCGRINMNTIGTCACGQQRSDQ